MKDFGNKFKETVETNFMWKHVLVAMVIVLVGLSGKKVNAQQTVRIPIGSEQVYTSDHNIMYFTFTTPAGNIPSYYDITYKNLSNSDGFFIVFKDSDYLERVSGLGRTSIYAWSNSVSTVQYYLQPNTTYYVMLCGNYNGAGRKIYDLGNGTHKITIKDLRDELPDTVSNSYTIGFHSKVQYALQASSDKDWFCFRTPAYSSDSIYGFNLGKIDSWFSVYLYDSYSCTNQVAYLSTGLNNVILEPNHTYYAKISGWKATRYSIELIDYQSVSKQKVTIKSVQGKKKKIKLTWGHIAVGNVRPNNYAIYRATKKNGKYKLIGYSSSNTYTDSSVKRKKKYYYKVKGYYSFNNGSYKYYSKAGNGKAGKSK